MLMDYHLKPLCHARQVHIHKHKTGPDNFTNINRGIAMPLC